MLLVSVAPSRQLREIDRVPLVFEDNLHRMAEQWRSILRKTSGTQTDKSSAKKAQEPDSADYTAVPTELSLLQCVIPRDLVADIQIEIEAQRSEQSSTVPETQAAAAGCLRTAATMRAVTSRQSPHPPLIVS